MDYKSLNHILWPEYTYLNFYNILIIIEQIIY